jgi:hypothetical protein
MKKAPRGAFFHSALCSGSGGPSPDSRLPALPTFAARFSIRSRLSSSCMRQPSGTGDSRRFPTEDSKQSHPDRNPRGRYAQFDSSLARRTSKTVHSIPAASRKVLITTPATALVASSPPVERQERCHRPNRQIRFARISASTAASMFPPEMTATHLSPGLSILSCTASAAATPVAPAPSATTLPRMTSCRTASAT